MMRGPRELLLGDGLIASTGELWKRQRRLMSTFFTPRGGMSLISRRSS